MNISEELHKQELDYLTRDLTDDQLIKLRAYYKKHFSKEPDFTETNEERPFEWYRRQD